jgi:argininosuccinate synthase
VQEIRSLRARTLNPGRPTDGYLLSKLAQCERWCGAAMHGAKGGRNDIRRHYCAGRKQGHRLRWLATARTRRTSRRVRREYAATLGVLGF